MVSNARPTIAQASGIYSGDSEPEWYVELLNCGLAYAELHGLRSHYRSKLRGIPSARLNPTRAANRRKSLTSPLWQVVNELVVGAILEFGLGWKFEAHEPVGRDGRHGEWQFAVKGGYSVFVEVKTVEEAELGNSPGAFGLPDQRAKLQDILEKGYEKLPSDGRRTLVVVCGGRTLKVPGNLSYSQLCQAMLGQQVVTFTVGDSPTPTYSGPSFHDMGIGPCKLRKLGCVGGLRARGLEKPEIEFYLLDNPFANPELRLNDGDVTEAWRIMFEGAQGSEREGQSTERLWAAMVAGVSGGGTT